MVKLNDLKLHVYDNWVRRHTYNQCAFTSSGIDNPDFKKEIRGYGDLRYKATWIKAYASFEALNIWDGCSYAYNLILISFNFSPNSWDYEFRHQVFEQFMMIDGALDLLKLGFEQLLTDDFTQEEREQAYGILELVSRESGTRGIRTDVSGFRDRKQLAAVE